MMNTFNKFPNSSKWIIGILTVLNIACITALWLGRPRPPRPPFERMLHQMENQLHLSDSQIGELKQLIQQQGKEQEAVKNTLDQLREQQLEQIASPYPDTALLQLLFLQIGEKHSEREQLVFKHFQELSKLCNPDQQEKLRSLFRRSLDRKGPPQH